MTDFAWDPETYERLMAEEVPDYPVLQEELLAATLRAPARTALDLGIGSGLTAARVLAAHPEATLVGVDANVDMLAAARRTLDAERTTLHQADLRDALPDGPFDLVLSMLAVHHLDTAGKADLFRRVAGVLTVGGRFVLADLVVPEDPADVVTPVDGVEDVPSPLTDQLSWLTAAGLRTEIAWRHRDLAVVTGTRTG
ncbi:class I SAM-dependent methyltransferase [Streptomyces oceani]|uniref:Methyltransferase n=1 Tax=Streptomyces oceani TaxID=1075402 RepID=A0A1E7KLU9_9ACTN|nr:class I SAM-dependent methyltransferase [Streptomyces oceani]OEV04867.1 methyltransferase [Streptomyces oceani]